MTLDDTRRNRRSASQIPPAEEPATPPAESPYYREILVSVREDEPRTAVLEHGQTVEVDMERPGIRRIVGDVYKGRVQNVLRGMQAAFIDIGMDKNAFLHVDDARLVPDLEHEGLPPVRAAGESADIVELLRPGQEVIVQVRKEASGGKGPRVSRALSLPGRFLVLMPGLDYVGISRRIEDEGERERLRTIIHGLRDPGFGVIVRTAAAGVDIVDLHGDWRYLQTCWAQVCNRARRAKAPALLHRDLDLVERVLRDKLTDDVLRVAVDSSEEWERVRALTAAMAPLYVDRVELATGAEIRQGLFAARGVDLAVDRALARRVPLPSGGSIIFDQTEALTAIDVNTGRFVGTASPDETFFATNLEAAAEIARQLRLRDIGGIIIIDFIDMQVPEHRKAVVDALDAACQPDHSRPQILGLTQLGLVEMTRKKARQSLRDLLSRPCPTCEGSGRLLTEETLSRRVKRTIRGVLLEAPAEAILVEVHPSVAAMVIGAGGAALRDLEQQTGRTVFVRGSNECHIEEIRVRAHGTRQEVEAVARPVQEGQQLEVRVEEAHMNSKEDGIARVEGYVLDIEGGAVHVGRRVHVEIMRAFRTYARARLVP